ncbi:MAG: nucleotide exchange factor GrpE [Planctomycetota bacterium]
MKPEENQPVEDANSDVDASAQTQPEQPERADEVDELFEEVLDETPQPKSDNERVIEAEKAALLAKAEMENYRKRIVRDMEQQLKYANMPLIRDLLEVWDNLQRAVGAAEEDNPSTQALRDGVTMVSQQMTDALAKYGCRRVEALGEEFDPNFHEAISQMPSEEYEAGKVMNEVGVGYVLHDRVVRPSHVIVSTGPQQ